VIIAQVEGGIGSQMFGYAAARRLALAHDDRVFIDARNFRTYKKFELELQHYDVEATLLSDIEADAVCGPDNQLIQVVRNKHLHFDSSVLDVPAGNILMIGNFVSEDYFFDIKDVIRKDFTRVSEPTEYAKGVSSEIASIIASGRQPVAVHIRRGDYVSEEETNKFHGLLGAEYYANAMALARKLIDNPMFVFFSNDWQWVQDSYGAPDVVVTKPPDDSPPVEDMTLMRECHHHILANSGYAWWSAWLANHEGQIVIGPRPFLANREHNSEDILPREWISLGSQPRPSPVTKVSG
jgi:hypothetical protein